jgi:hypothetical protein
MMEKETDPRLASLNPKPADLTQLAKKKWWQLSDRTDDQNP